MNKIKPYEGDLPYIFISYAHANSPAVMQITEVLSERGYRIWYDEGIEVGSEWPEYIAEHLAKAGLMIAFLSNAYIRSDNCRKEMHYALSKKIPIINIFLEETQMTPGMEMQVGNVFALMKQNMTEEIFYTKLLGASQLSDDLLENTVSRPGKINIRKAKKPVPIDLTVEAQKKKKQKIRRFASLGVFLVLLVTIGILGLVGWSTGLIPRLRNRREQVVPVTPEEATVIPWTERTMELAAREYSGIAEGDITVSDLTGLRELYICGDSWSFSDPEKEPADERSPSEGAIQSLDDLQYFPDLTVLVLENQPLDSLETLPACHIEILRLNGCNITSLGNIANLPLLRELEVVGCPLRDLGDLEYCLQLHRLCLSGETVRSFAAVKPLTKLAEVEISGSSLNTLKPVFRHSSLSDIHLKDCDLRGRFFYSFDRERNIVTLSLENCKLNSTKNLDDFTGLTTLSLKGSGETLDWGVLSALPALKTVYADAGIFKDLETVLDGSKTRLIQLE